MKGCDTGQVIDKITDCVYLSLAETKCCINKHHLSSAKKKKNQPQKNHSGGFSLGSTGMHRVNKENQTPVVDPVQV